MKSLKTNCGIAVKSERAIQSRLPLLFFIKIWVGREPQAGGLSGSRARELRLEHICLKAMKSLKTNCGIAVKSERAIQSRLPLLLIEN